MTLFVFLLGLLLIFAIARYNESNKLFWIMLCSYIGAFTLTKIINEATSHENKVEYTSMYSTQELPNVLHLYAVTSTMDTTTCEHSSNLVSKNELLVNIFDNIFIEVTKKARDQPYIEFDNTS